MATQKVGLSVANSLAKDVGDAFGLDLSLAGGLSGLLVLFSLLQEQDDPSWEEDVHKIVFGIKSLIESGQLHDLSLHGGLAGVCFSIDLASKKHGRYQKMLSALDHLLLKNVYSQFINPIHKNCSSNTPSSARLYDTIQGLSGIGRYALSKNTDEFNQFAFDSVEALILFCKPLTVNGLSVPGWYLPSHDPLNRRILEKDQMGTFNLGLSHGITGVLAFLSIAYLKGLRCSGQLETIKMITDWILVIGQLQWPSSITWEQETRKELSNLTPTRDAWCYGAPGVSRTLFLASQALDDASLKQKALKSFKFVFERAEASIHISPKNLWNLPGPTICHGISGLLILTNQMYKDTKDPYLESKIPELVDLILSDYSDDHLFKFQELALNDENQMVLSDREGLLDGAAGVALTLLTLSNKRDDWQLPFLIHV